MKNEINKLNKIVYLISQTIFYKSYNKRKSKVKIGKFICERISNFSGSIVQYIISEKKSFFNKNLLICFYLNTDDFPPEVEYCNDESWIESFKIQFCKNKKMVERFQEDNKYSSEVTLNWLRSQGLIFDNGKKEK